MVQQLRDTGKLKQAENLHMTETAQQVSPWVSTYVPLMSTVVVAVATVFLVWLTSRYVRLTRQLVEETQRSREPSVSIDFEIPDCYLHLVVTNHGLSPAKNIRISVLKELPWFRTISGSTGLGQIGPFKNGISYLSPSRKLKYLLGPAHWKGAKEEQKEASFQVTFEDENKKRYEHIVDFNFGQFNEILHESFKDSNLAVAEAIRDAERTRQISESSQRSRTGILQRFSKKKCPMCAEMIPTEAKKCAHCLELLEKNEPGQSGLTDSSTLVVSEVGNTDAAGTPAPPSG